MIIADRMKKNPATATPDMSISDATAKMKAEKVHRLPVLDDEKHLVGVISEKDILELNIPTGVPLLYELDENLKPISHRYLGDAEAIAKGQAAVASQVRAKK